jgi:hypothetical protein
MEERVCFGVIVVAPSAHEPNAERRNVDLQATWRGGHPVDRDSNTGAGAAGDIRTWLLRFLLPQRELPE